MSVDQDIAGMWNSDFQCHKGLQKKHPIVALLAMLLISDCATERKKGNKYDLPLQLVPTSPHRTSGGDFLMAPVFWDLSACGFRAICKASDASTSVYLSHVWMNPKVNEFPESQIETGKVSEWILARSHVRQETSDKA